jgi:hypothetical protein
MDALVEQGDAARRAVLRSEGELEHGALRYILKGDGDDAGGPHLEASVIGVHSDQVV